MPTASQVPATPSAFEISKKDTRRPLFLGFWLRSKPECDSEFAKDGFDDPHVKRKIAVLQKHPEAAWLYGYEPLTQPITILCVACQLILAYLFGAIWTFSLPAFLLTAYLVGGSITHMLGVIIHECTHSLAHKTSFGNKMYGLICNIVIPVPIALSFRRYHFEHHTYQGVCGKDPDLPLEFEYRLVRGSTICKFVWMAFFPLMYVIRGAVFGKRPSTWEVINTFCTVATDLLILTVCGPVGLLYLFSSLWLGYAFHPAAAHFIQEHYTFQSGQETYSYYGSLNPFFLNIGYHNEHHDFPKIPWTRLPILKAMAPEFYEPLSSHQSWVMVLWSFITNASYGPQSRCSRDVETYTKGRKMISRLPDDVVQEAKEGK